jgi:Tfp pilus assembly protein PilF
MKRLALSLLVVVLSGCAGMTPLPQTAPPELFADARFAPPSAPVGARDLFTLSPAMQAYLHSPEFAALQDKHGAERGLIEALYSKQHLKLEYESSRTRTAAETYAERSGNCLSLVVMTAAFARELGMRVLFQRVDVEETWGRSGNLYLTAGHVNVVIGSRLTAGIGIHRIAEHSLVVDFLAPSDAARLQAHPLEDQEVEALFMNNRAAESMVGGRLDDAYWWAHAAIDARPTMAASYNTLAVVYQRHGDLALAERAYRAALAREPENAAVMLNLAPVLDALGHHDEARAMAAHAASIDPVPPFTYFNKGMAALKNGEAGKAKALFEREVKRAPYYDEFHFWLAVAQLQLGDAGAAKEQLALALDTSTRRDTKELYSAKLAHLREQSWRPTKYN